MSTPAYTPGPYIIGLPGGPAGPFYSLVNAAGNVVAMQITSGANAKLFALAPETDEIARQALMLREAERAHERQPDAVNAENVANIREVLDVQLALWGERTNGAPPPPSKAASSGGKGGVS